MLIFSGCLFVKTSCKHLLKIGQPNHHYQGVKRIFNKFFEKPRLVTFLRKKISLALPSKTLKQVFKNYYFFINANPKKFVSRQGAKQRRIGANFKGCIDPRKKFSRQGAKQRCIGNFNEQIRRNLFQDKAHRTLQGAGVVPYVKPQCRSNAVLEQISKDDPKGLFVLEARNTGK